VGKYQRKKRYPKRNKRETKKETERKHARKRFKERFDIAFDKSLRNELVKRIQTQDFFKAEKQSHRVTKFHMTVREHNCVVIYDKNRKEIITVLFDELEK